MTFTASRRSTHRKWGVSLALLASAVALAGSSQALLPASAAALENTGSKCEIKIDMVWVEVCMEENAGGGTTGWIVVSQPGPSGPGSGGGSPTPVAGGGIGDPGPGPEDGTGSAQTQSSSLPPKKRGMLGSALDSIKRWVKQWECGRLREKVRGRIQFRMRRDFRIKNPSFDEVTGSGDDVLDMYQRWVREEGC